MISVIIPVYNGEKYVKTIIESFEKQKNQDFELILINDGSKDDSLNEMEESKQKSKLNIVIINQVTNGGVSVARNLGIDHANGEFICFCDVDDEVMNDYLSSMLETIEHTKADLVICKHVSSRGEVSEEVRNIQGTSEVVTKESLSALKDFLYGRLVSGSCTLMVRKSILQENNLRFAEGYKYSEDLHMVWRLLACSPKIVYLDRYLYIYKIQDNSATSRFDNERLHGYQLMKDLELFFDKQNPEFANEYKKYGASKIMWSIAWQAAVNYDYKKFKEFVRAHRIRREMVKLITFKKVKVSLSAIAFLLSPYVFRNMAIKIGKKYVH